MEHQLHAAVPRGAGGYTLPLELRPSLNFDQVSRQVINYLKETTGLDVWVVTRVANGNETVLESTGGTEHNAVDVGFKMEFRNTLCRRMVFGEADRVNPDIRQVPAFAPAIPQIEEGGLAIKSYLGTPIVRADGTLFGTLCGFDPDVRPELAGMEPLLDLFSSVLSAVVEVDLAATEAARQVERARRESTVDPLTGLLNRRGWDQFLENEDARLRRFGDPATVVLIDLDGLKTINDSRGHDAGDRHLCQAAAVLTRHTRGTDVVARLGGDEFGIVAVNTEEQAGGRLAHRIERALESAGVPGSVGHAEFSVATGFEQAQRDADAAMYERKRERRANRIAS